ncbi:rod-determining factor RdfA [Natrinema versiforme]|uniref:Uncharacterized protein n=1 Tax=Natrinema versiforme TaxID=88724 RepID=A0A4P8WMV7_9EURY|nr:rod-determining factor RdfA [Natrinema versiforme]QCS44542.1 hypothetical protein FEJ81_19695 [Natrinema versiforme]
MTQHNQPESTCTCKIGTLADAYELDSLYEELVARWTGAHSEEESVRTLADRFNQRLLRAEMRDANIELVEGRVENLYELLTDEDRLEAVRLEAQSTLERNGIDVDRLQNQFVSHQTMYRHFRNCLDVEKERNVLTTEKERDRIHSIQHRAESVVDDSVARLRDGGKLDIDEFEVLINFRISCEHCGTLHDVTDLLEAGGCDCQM